MIDFQWWLGTPAVRELSVGARGLLADLATLMAVGEPVGWLTDATGRPYTAAQIAAVVRLNPKQIGELMPELMQSGVLARDADGVVYCPDLRGVVRSKVPAGERPPVATEAVTGESRGLTMQEAIAEIQQNPPDRLVMILDRWNRWRADGLVPHGTTATRPTREIANAWRKVPAVPELKQLWIEQTEDTLDRVEDRLRTAGPFLTNGKWFMAHKLFTSNNNQQLIVERLLAGGYEPDDEPVIVPFGSEEQTGLMEWATQDEEGPRPSA